MNLTNAAQTRIQRAVPQAPQVQVDDARGTRLLILAATPLRIGRSEACQLYVEGPGVSREHLQLSLEPEGYYATDLGSANGSFLNGKQLIPHQPTLLSHGDLLHLDQPTTPDAVRLLFELGAPLQLIATIALANQALTIGRSGEIALDHPLVSRLHARIERTTQGYLLHDLHSTNGTLLNGKPMLQAHLQPGDTIQIGLFLLFYRGAALELYDRRHALGITAEQLNYQIAGKPILQQISLAAQPGELVAIVGASGAGKSTLLSLLAGRITPTTGQIRLSGNQALHPQISVGLVPQHEPLHANLVLAEALSYTASLRLPADTTAQELARRVEVALSAVDLTHVRHTRVGQLSGGQRRRAAVAAELLADPPILLFDEPTAGLDPGLERRTFNLLRTLADTGRTILVATHATEQVLLCDRVVFLAHGRLVYDAPPEEAAFYFGVNGFPAVYDLLDDQAQATHWAERFQPMIAAKPAIQPKQPAAARYSYWHQLTTLTKRTITLLCSDWRNLAILFIQAPAIGLLLAISARADALVGEHAAANEARKVLFLMATTAIWCGVINAARAIAAERLIILHERYAGLHSGPYLLSKVIAFLPLLFFQAVALLALTLLKVAIPPQGIFLPLPVELLIAMLLAGLAGLALGLAISATTRNPDRATSLVPLVIIPQILFAGAIFGLGDGFTMQRLLSWFTASRWALDAMGSSANLNTLPLLPGLLRPAEPAAEYLFSASQLLSRWGILLLYTVICLVVAWRALEKDR